MPSTNVPTDVRAIEAEADAAWQGLAAFRLPEWLLIRGLLTMGSLKLSSKMGEAMLTDMPQFVLSDQIRRLQGGLRWCLLWALNPGRSIDNQARLNPEDIAEALRLGADYDDLSDMFKSCGRGLACAKVIGPGAAVQFDYVTGDRGAVAFQAYRESMLEDVGPLVPPSMDTVSRARQHVRQLGWLAAL